MNENKEDVDLLEVAEAIEGDDDSQTMRAIAIALIDIAKSQRAMVEMQRHMMAEDIGRLERDEKLRQDEFEETKNQNEYLRSRLDFQALGVAAMTGLESPMTADLIAKEKELRSADANCTKCGALKSQHLFISVDEGLCVYRDCSICGRQHSPWTGCIR